MADLADLSPEPYAALVAPVIERLTFAVVRGMLARTSDRPPPPPGVSMQPMRMFAQLRTGLAARELTMAGIAAVYRYRKTDDVRADLEALRSAGLIEIAGESVRATERGHAVLAGMYAGHAQVAAELWHERDASLAMLNGVAGLVVHAALQTGGEAYATVAPPHEPADATVALLLHHRLSVLRYHRADAHAAAWQAAGMASDEMQQMPAGPERDAIEAETNRRAGVPYAILTPDERLAFLAGLAALPG